MSEQQPTIQGLGPEDTRWLIQEVQAILRELGETWTVVDEVVFELSGGQVLGLDNLARRLQLFPRARWQELVRDQLTTLLPFNGPPESVEPAALRAKLVHPETMPDLEYEPLELLPGLPAVLSAQMPGFTISMGSLDLVDDRDDAYAVAMENLTRLPQPQHARRRLDPHLPKSWVEFLDAGDSFGASRVMVLPDLMRRTLQREFPASGVLVAVPTKFELWIHLPVDESVIETSLLLAYDAYDKYVSEPFPLSPDVYVVSPDMRAEVLVRPDRTGAFVNDDAFARLLASLGHHGPAEAA